VGLDMRVLVCGGRDFTNRALVYSTLDAIANKYNLWATPDDYGNSLPLGLTIISGAARGADRIAADYAVVNWTGLKEFPADWKRYGKSAGPIRNKQMLDEGKPDLVIAFPGGRGTANMVAQARRAGIPVIEVPDANAKST
jgi:ABC-type Fe3+-hydroxamate transport system substrate-binding protein